MNWVERIILAFLVFVFMAQSAYYRQEIITQQLRMLQQKEQCK